MRSPKGKVQNLIISNTVAGVCLPDSWLDNPNVHLLLNLGHLSTPALTKMIYLIFLWAEFFRRGPIPVVNPSLYKVCLVGGRWGAHSNLVLPKNKKETD